MKYMNARVNIKTIQNNAENSSVSKRLNLLLATLAEGLVVGDVGLEMGTRLGMLEVGHLVSPSEVGFHVGSEVMGKSEGNETVG